MGGGFERAFARDARIGTPDLTMALPAWGRSKPRPSCPSA